MKRWLLPLLWLMLLALLLPAGALAGGGCSEGYHDLEMVDFAYPTCERSGFTKVRCKNCSYTSVESTPPNGHTWEVRTVVPSTCDYLGYTTYVCAECSQMYTEQHTDKVEHNWVNAEHVEDTCTQDGYNVSECTLCGARTVVTIPSRGHKWETLGVTREPTCTEKGYREAKCKYCGEVDTRTISATGHSWVDDEVTREATCAREGKVTTVCTACGKKSSRTIDKLPHNVTSWTIVRKATDTAKGSRRGVCTECGKKVTESYEIAPGDVAVSTSAGKVNLRSGPSTGKKRMDVVEKRGTYLGQLLESDVDQKGNVWFKVRYQDKLCWIMAEYAACEVDIADPTALRLPDATGTELSNYFLKSFGPVAEALELESSGAEEAAVTVWEREGVFVAGTCYAEEIHLSVKGYTVYGVKVGDKVSTARKTLKKKGLLPDDGDDCHFRIPCVRDALAVDDAGCCGSVLLIEDGDGRVAEIRLSADIPDEW